MLQSGNEKITFRKADDFDKHPSGIFDATVVDLSLEDGQFGPSTRFVFETDLDQIWGFASGTKYSTKNKLGGWIGAILNKPVSSFGELDSADIIGRSCRIQVGPNANGDIRVLAVMPATAADDGSEQPDVAQDHVPF